LTEHKPIDIHGRLINIKKTRRFGVIEMQTTHLIRKQTVQRRYFSFLCTSPHIRDLPNIDQL